MNPFPSFSLYCAVTSKEEADGLLLGYDNLLISYAFFRKNPQQAVDIFSKAEKSILDSGAFAAFTTGREVYLDQYASYIHEVQEGVDDFEYVALDSIGDGAKTFALLERMLEAGLSPIPVLQKEAANGTLQTLLDMGFKRLCFGGLLGSLNKDYLDEMWGIVAGRKDSDEINIHGLGVTNMDSLKRYPWGTVDSSSVSMCYRFGFALTGFDQNRLTFTAKKKTHDYIRGFVPEWEDQPLGVKPNKLLGGISPRQWLLRDQSGFYKEAETAFQVYRKKTGYPWLGSQLTLGFFGTAAWVPESISDEDLPLIAPPEIRKGRGVRLPDLSDSWDLVGNEVSVDLPDFNVPNVFAIDFESLYNSSYSVKSMGARLYSLDERFEAYCVSVVGEGKGWCGVTERAAWDKLYGKTILAHNAGFEQYLCRRLELDEVIPKGFTDSCRWICTADMSAFVGCGRALDVSAKTLLGITVDKDVRDRLKYRNCTSEELLEYGLKDSITCYQLWQKLNDVFPSHEQRLADETRRIGRGNIHVDIQKAEQWRDEIKTFVESDPFSKDIPFSVNSNKQAASFFLENYGAEAPPNWRANDPFYYAWKQDLPIPARDLLERREEIRKAVRLQGVIQAVLDRTDEASRLFYELKYFGARPGRWSGGGGLNMQNWNRGARWNIRELLVAPPGHILGILDFSQIEARSLLWLAEDWDQLKLIREIGDVYEAHARSTMNYTYPGKLADVDKDLRALAKARVLALGYGCGSAMFQFMADWLCKLKLEMSTCVSTVEDYRETNWRIVELWQDRIARARKKVGRDFHITIPSGRDLIYRGLHYREQEKFGRTGKSLFASLGGRVSGIYGGLLIENENQAFCRDIMGAAWLRCVNANYLPNMTIHDELIFNFKEEKAEKDLKVVKGLMEMEPTWCEGLPLGVSSVLSRHYTK